MDYELTVSDDRKYISLKITGEITREPVMDPTLAAHTLGHKMGTHRLLIDVTEAINVDTIFNNYQLAYTDMRGTPGIIRNARMALLVSPADHSHNFIETVARNSGHDLKLFRDRDRALAYLLERSTLS